VQVAGYLALSQIISRHQGNPGNVVPQAEIYRVDVEAIQRQLDYDILPLYVIESPPEGEVDELPFNQPRNVEVTEGSHLSYALQWFSFSIMLAVIYVVYVHRAVKKGELVEEAA
jgi:surfeit locus 1 family protein